VGAIRQRRCLQNNGGLHECPPQSPVSKLVKFPPEGSDAEEQALTNPVEATRESIGTGRTRYVYACRQCHGNRGQGDGDMSHAGGVPSDFTDDIWQHGETDGEIYLVIRDGVSADMQPYQNQIPEEDIWHLVNYLKSLSK
jgi:mono/diheme cytochrome c family protein